MVPESFFSITVFHVFQVAPHATVCPPEPVALRESHSHLRAMTTATRLTIHGRVQGVFYRDWTIKNARELRLTGWVRNEPDGTVAAHLEGSREKVEDMVARMHSGPPAANVERIEQSEAEPEGLDGFERR